MLTKLINNLENLLQFRHSLPRFNFTRLTLPCNLGPQICGYPVVQRRTRFRVNRLPYRRSVLETRSRMALVNCRFWQRCITFGFILRQINHDAAFRWYLSRNLVPHISNTSSLEPV